VCHHSPQAEGEKSSKNSNLPMDRPFGAAVLIAAVCSSKPSLYAKLLNFCAFFALQITTGRGRLQQIKPLIQPTAKT
jgi:hypothetical protein